MHMYIYIYIYTYIYTYIYLHTITSRTHNSEGRRLERCWHIQHTPTRTQLKQQAQPRPGVVLAAVPLTVSACVRVGTTAALGQISQKSALYWFNTANLGVGGLLRICIRWQHERSEALVSHVPDMNESCLTYECVMSHMSMGHDPRMNASCLTYECVMSHTWISHVSQMNESCLTYEWILSHTWMSHVSQRCGGVEVVLAIKHTYYQCWCILQYVAVCCSVWQCSHRRGGVELILAIEQLQTSTVFCRA